MANLGKIISGVTKVVRGEDKKIVEAMKNTAAIEKRAKAIDKADTAKVTREVRKVIKKAEESGKYKKTPVKNKKNGDRDSYESGWEQGERVPRKKLPPARPQRKTVSNEDAAEVAREMKIRPSGATRGRDVKKRSLKSLTPSEKRYEELGKKAPVRVTRKKPMSLAEIKKAKNTARKAKFDKVLATRPKPKPNRAPLKPIDKSRGSNRPVKPRLSDEGKILDNAANNPLNSKYGGKPKPGIAEGRGNVQQPPSVTTNPIKRTREARIEARKAKRANLRDKRTDIRESSTPGFEKLQPVRRGVPRNAEQRAEARANADARARLAAKARKGSKMSKRSTTNDPRNAASDAGNMKNRLREIDKAAAEKAKKQELYKGNNKVSPELKAKVNATLGSSNKAKKGKALQNTFNKPKFSRNVKTGRLRATRPIKPVKK